MLLKTILLKTNNVFTVLLFCIGVISINACSENEKLVGGYDPNKPVEIAEFEPKGGPARTRLYITGKNFGTDVSQIFVRVGGVDAKVIGSNGEIIYCIVPPKATEGTVEVAVGSPDHYTVATETFKYESRPLVRTLCGYVDELGKVEAKDGSFDECGFNGPRWLVVDPQNVNHLYLVDGVGKGDFVRKLDLEKREVSSMFTRQQLNIGQIRQIEFSVTGDSLLIANEAEPENFAVALTLRKFGFVQNPQQIGRSILNNACGTHPKNGELYFNSRKDGSLYRYDWETGATEKLYTVIGDGAQYFLFFHPSGKYAYITVPSKKVIMKAEYDQVNKKLLAPTIFCGKEGTQGASDGVGSAALLANPFQGCFVKNEQYVEENREDIYDFYFADQYAHAIRYVTPEAHVHTFAGRGSIGTSEDGKGYVDGDLLTEARFESPIGLIYDEDNRIFYVSDFGNKRIRVIDMEGE